MKTQKCQTLDVYNYTTNLCGLSESTCAIEMHSRVMGSIWNILGVVKMLCLCMCDSAQIAELPR